jgi:hypothetical protein
MLNIKGPGEENVDKALVRQNPPFHTKKQDGMRKGETNKKKDGEDGERT